MRNLAPDALVPGGCSCHQGWGRPGRTENLWRRVQLELAWRRPAAASSGGRGLWFLSLPGGGALADFSPRGVTHGRGGLPWVQQESLTLDHVTQSSQTHAPAGREMSESRQEGGVVASGRSVGSGGERQPLDSVGEGPEGGRPCPTPTFPTELGTVGLCVQAPGFGVWASQTPPQALPPSDEVPAGPACANPGGRGICGRRAHFSPASRAP